MKQKARDLTLAYPAILGSRIARSYKISNAGAHADDIYIGIYPTHGRGLLLYRGTNIEFARFRLPQIRRSTRLIYVFCRALPLCPFLGLRRSGTTWQSYEFFQNQPTPPLKKKSTQVTIDKMLDFFCGLQKSKGHANL